MIGENTALFCGEQYCRHVRHKRVFFKKCFVLMHLIVFSCCSQRGVAVKLHYKNAEDVAPHINIIMKKQKF